MDRFTESKPFVLAKDYLIWKVFEERFMFLKSSTKKVFADTTIHHGTVIPTGQMIHSKTSRPFERRSGFMAFPSYAEAAQYAILLSCANQIFDFKVKKCVAPAGTQMITGIIDYNFVGHGRPCIRVESYKKEI